MNRLIFLLLLFASQVYAEAIDMQDYNLLRNGMTEAEVLYRLGPYDHEVVKSDHYDYIFSKTWFYIPTQGSNSSKRWISEIRFNHNGELISRDRYRVK